MNIVGIIAEFNPFHNGHKYIIDQAKQCCNADYVVVVMSGNFTQRGTPAIYDKYARTKTALLSGADLVVEMPVVAAASGAKDFARCGVALLNSMGIVTHLAFGCENPNINDLTLLADILYKEPFEFQLQLKSNLKDGLSWPSARQKAIEDLYPNLSNYLKEPNNILALEYLMALKELNSAILPMPIQRIQTGFHDLSVEHSICSATALRHLIQNGAPIEKTLYHMPQCIHEYAQSLIIDYYPMSANTLSGALAYKLINETPESLFQYIDIDGDLAQRIYNEKDLYNQFDSFCLHLNHKAYTYTRISRALVHVLLDIKKADRQFLVYCNYAPYFKVLGFRKKSSQLLTLIHGQSSLPLLTRNSRDTLLIKNQYAKRLLQLDLYASQVYRFMFNLNAKQPMAHENSTPIIII